MVPLDLELGPHRLSTMPLVCARSALAIPRVRVVAELLGAELVLMRERPRASP